MNGSPRNNGGEAEALELHRQELFSLAYRFANETAAKAAWEEAVALTERPEVTISVYRGRLPSGACFVVAISTEADPVEQAGAALAERGQPVELPAEVLRRLITRAMRVGGLGRRAVQLKVRHGRTGVSILGDGAARPRRRPQG